MILVAVLVIVLLAFRVWHVMESQDEMVTKTLANGNDSGVTHLWNKFVDQYATPFGHVCVSLIYAVYTWFTLINVTVFILKYVPTGLYMYKFLRNIYTTSRERLKQKQMELEDIQLQIQIVNTKLCGRDSEFTERTEQLRREADRLRKVRARVRKIIATDEALRRALGSTFALENEDADVHSTPEQDREFIVEMLKGLKNVSIPERQYEHMECGEYAQTNHNSPENSVYSSLSDMDIKQDCRVTIVKVTNVYKVANLKNFIKKKRLRRAQRHALLKKRMESIRNLLEEWQESLSSVINLTILNMASRIDGASQEAMGDFSKPTLREYCDSDSDLRNGCDEATHEEYNHGWAQNNYRNSCYNYEDMQEPGLHREFCEPRENSDVKCTYQVIHPCECLDPRDHKLFALPEETSSQMAIEKIISDGEDCQTYADAVV